MTSTSKWKNWNELPSDEFSVVNASYPFSVILIEIFSNVAQQEKHVPKRESNTSQATDAIKWPEKYISLISSAEIKRN